MLASLGTVAGQMTVAVAPIFEVPPPPPEGARPPPPVVLRAPRAVDRLHLYGAGLLHLTTLGSGEVEGGAEAGVTASVLRFLDAGVAVVPGRHTGGQVLATIHAGFGRVRPFAQFRLSLTPVSGGVAVGGGGWLGGSVELGPGRLLAGIAGMRYLLPSSAASQFWPYTVMGLAGYELDLGAL